jgi:hypothetical protein
MNLRHTVALLAVSLAALAWSDADACQTFTLLVVTPAGDVKRTPDFPTRRSCEQAKSIAVHGRTVEQQEAHEEIASARRKAIGATYLDVIVPAARHAECIAESQHQETTK